jgi:hypothetical protein
VVNLKWSDRVRNYTNRTIAFKYVIHGLVTTLGGISSDEEEQLRNIAVSFGRSIAGKK